MAEKLMVDQYEFYYNLFENGGHTLVAGKTRSGKSVILNGLIVTAMLEHAQLILLDPKGGVEFAKYKDCVETIAYAGCLEEFKPALERAVAEMMRRNAVMVQKRITKSQERPLFVIVDEYASMMTDAKKDLQPLLLKLARMGAASNVRLVLATQTPYLSIVTGDIKNNMQSIVALKVRNKSFSRLILDEAGAENLHVGEALVLLDSDDAPHKERVPMYPLDLLEQIALLRTPPSKRWK